MLTKIIDSKFSVVVCLGRGMCSTEILLVMLIYVDIGYWFGLKLDVSHEFV